MATQIINPKIQFDDDNGDPCAGCKVFFYDTGTTTKRDSFTDSGEGTPNSNPVVLNSAGQASIWIDGQYRVVLAPATDTDPPASPIWTVDNVDSVITLTLASDAIFLIGHNSDGTHRAYDLLSNHADLAAAVATIAATPTLLKLDQADSSNATVPRTLAVQPVIGNVMSGTVAWNGPVETEPLFQWLSGSGHTFSPAAVKRIFPDWWQTNTTPRTTVMDTAIQLAINACLNASTESINLHLPTVCNIETGGIDIDKVVDGQPDSYFMISAVHQGGFYTNEAITMFSNTFDNSTDPQTQLVLFDHVPFESGTPSNEAYVINGNAFLRTEFNYCDFDAIKSLTATIYTQAIAFENCNMRRWEGIFYNSPVVSFDIHFNHCIAEAGGAFAVIRAAVGCGFLSTEIEGMSDTAIKYDQAQALSITGPCYFEGNARDSGYDIDGTPGTGSEATTSHAVTINAILSHVNNQAYVPFNMQSIKWGLCDSSSSQCYFSGNNLVQGDDTTRWDVTNPAGDTWRYTWDGTGTDPEITTNLLNDYGVTIEAAFWTNEALYLGDDTTQWDVTDQTGDVWRYTFDGTGTDPGITTDLLNGYILTIGGGFNAVNEGTFTVTDSDTDWFEITNASGVEDLNVTDALISSLFYNNQGRFIITDSDTDYFEITNENGYVESDITGATITARAVMHDLLNDGAAVKSKVKTNDFATTFFAVDGGEANAYFSAQPAATQTNIEVGSDVKIEFGTEVEDVGGNFASSIFKASRTGRHRFPIKVTLVNLDSSATSYDVILRTSAKDYAYTYDPRQLAGDIAVMPFAWTEDVPMVAGQTAHLIINQTGGSQQTNISTASSFSGGYIGY